MKADLILVVDVESTCWESEAERGTQLSEIIEVGLALFDTTKHDIVGHAAWFVKPKHSEVSAFCSKLTGITQANVENAHNLSYVCDVLRREYKADQRVWASFGNYDRKMFESECNLKVIPYPFSHQHLNVKALVAAKYGKVVGTGHALGLCGLTFAGRQHRGMDDAINIANILRALTC